MLEPEAVILAAIVVAPLVVLALAWLVTAPHHGADKQ